MDRESYIPVKVQEPKKCASCDKVYKPLRKGLCQPCYKRIGRNGTTVYKLEYVEDITLVWVMKRCKRVGACLLWTQDALSKEGRPQVSDRKAWREEGKNRQIVLHRWMYEQHHRTTLRKGQHVKQTCGNKLCLAPAHLATSVPRHGRVPLGEAGQYKGRARRDDHFERCANGHRYTNETLYVDPNGRWICRICNTASHLGLNGAEYEGWQRRKPWEEKPACPNGHVYAEVGWYFNGEARVCIRCFAEKERKRWLRVSYGLTLEDFENLLIAQDFECRICHRTFDPGLHELTPCVDHSHETGEVRGLLCQKCNLGLGHCKDDATRLRAASEYLPPTDGPATA